MVDREVDRAPRRVDFRTRSEVKRPRLDLEVERIRARSLNFCILLERYALSRARRERKAARARRRDAVTCHLDVP